MNTRLILAASLFSGLALGAEAAERPQMANPSVDMADTFGFPPRRPGIAGPAASRRPSSSA
jgi:hypothetical protein